MPSRCWPTAPWPTGSGSSKRTTPVSLSRCSRCSLSATALWELHHAGVPLATVQFGVPRLPEQRLRRERLDDIADRVFRECDSDALWALATAAADAEHGTMLVISERAAEEAARLESQALTVEPTRLDDGLVRQVTGIDGAVLVDPSGFATRLESSSTAPPPGRATVPAVPATTPPSSTSPRPETRLRSSCWYRRTG